MDEENNKKKKNKIIGIIIRVLRPYLIGISIIIIILGLLAGLFHYFIKHTGIENPNDKKNGPAAARNLINSTNIGESGNIELGETIQETWDKLKKQGNAITKYLDSAQELAKLITAASALDYPDTRENPDEPINWNDIDINSKDIQGIVKFKRALSNGKTITMKYISPSKFNKLVNNYLKSGSESDKNEALKYFTVERTYSPTNGQNGLGDSRLNEILQYACSWVGKISYQLSAGGKLVDGGQSDCSHFVHRVFEHFGMLDEFVHSLEWGDAPAGTVKIGTDISKATPGDVIWEHYGGGTNNHVSIYLGKGKRVECAAGKGVVISNVPGGIDQILHFSQLPTDPTGYFDVETNTLYGASGSSSSGQAIIDEAEKYVGKLPYVWGGSSLDSGADCSGFVWAVLKKLGLYTGTRTNDVGFRTQGTEVSSLGSAQAGDVICYDGHIGFYDGHGGLIHESNHRDGCKHSGDAAYRTIVAIRRFAKSGTTNNTSTNNTSSNTNLKESSKTNTEPIPTDDFSTETRDIIMKHMSDFNGNTYRQFINSYPGGYDGYIKSLGGVFEKYGGIDNRIEVRTAGDLQEVAEYVWGLFSIWGFDYWNGDTYHAWGSDSKAREEGLYDNAYYQSHSYTGGGYSGGNIDSICSNPDKAMRTNCNCGVDSFLQKTTLIDHDIGASPGVGELVSSIDDLQVGDLVHMYKSDGWKHVAIVGERDPSTGDVILYDAGNRFITTGRYKKIFKEFSGDDYSGAGYIRWVGRRNFDIDQTSNRTGTIALKNTVYKVKVATWQDCKETVVSKGTDKKKKDEYVKESSEYTYSMNVRTIPFQDIVAQYKMPFNYLWSMLLISQDKKYVFDLADTVRNSKIEITVFDNLKETTTTQDENYVRHYDYTGKMTGNIITMVMQLLPGNIQPQFITASESASAEETLPDPYVFDKITTTYDRTNTLEIALTLADAWCVKYEKNYKYAGKTNTIGYTSRIELEGYKEDPIPSNTITNSQLRESLMKTITGIIYRKLTGAGKWPMTSLTNKQLNVTSESQVLNVSVTNRALETSVATEEYKYLAEPGNATDNNSNVASGYIYSNSYNQIDTSKLNKGGTQQGFCLAGDYYAYVTETNNKSSLFLVDKNTNKQVDVVKGISGHGNTLAYDSKENQIIFIQDETENMLIYKIENNKLKYLRTRKLPKHDSGGVYVRSDLAYNAQNDKFILGEYVYKRDAFFSRGSPEVKIKYSTIDNTELQGSCSYGNHVFYNYSSANHKSGNYLIVCNILTGKQDEIIYDDMPLELEEGSFDKDGNLYLMYGKTQLYAVPYRYYNDNNLDVRKASNNSYSLGGNFYENNKFINVFNSHSSARSNILRNSEWLFDLIENNSDTANMLDLTKYLMYKASGIDFGVTEFQFEAYGMNGVGNQGSTLSITSTTFTKEQFTQLIQSYSGAISKGSGTKTFRDNAAVIYDVCVKNNINPVLCAAQAWKEQNWDDPSTSPYNFWGIAVYNGQNYGKSWGSMEDAVQGYCNQINSQINGKMKSTYQARAQQFATVNRKFIGDMSTLYDIFSAYAYIGSGHTLKEEADYAANYVDSLMKCATQIFGEGALTAGAGGGSDVVQFALKYEGKTAPEFGLFNYTSRCGARDIWYSSEWCAMFVSFCFDSCNKIPNPLPNSYASCSNGWSLIGSRQRASACRGGNYIPQPGDIIFYGSGAGSHTGIVESCDGSTVNTIEGNTGNTNNSLSRVNRRSRSINDGWIWGYGAMSN